MSEGQQALGLLKGLDPRPGGWGGGSLRHARAPQSSVQQLHSLVALHTTSDGGFTEERQFCKHELGFVQRKSKRHSPKGSTDDLSLCMTLELRDQPTHVCERAWVG